jgi:hypothetical protein
MKKIIAVRIHTNSLLKQQNQSDEQHKEIEMKTLVEGYVGRIISDCLELSIAYIGQNS